jgi:thiol:disulfide interchange protein DsbD
MDAIGALNEWIASQLGASSGVSTLGLLFLGGVAASLLPCVYPLYPITASILRSRAASGPRWIHPTTYHLGLAGVYFAFGIVAAVTGGAFNEVLRLPGANLGIGVLLFGLALATAGYLDFPMLGAQGDDRKGLVGTFVMGAGAGVLSSACVGPVVVAILVGMMSTAATPSVLGATLAATKMLCFGLGVGLPVLLIGVFGLALPKGGKWMVHVQRLFGVLIAVFSWGYVKKGLVGYEISSGRSDAIVLGALLVLLASYFLQSGVQPVAERTKRALLVLSGVVGFFLIGRNVLSAEGIAQASVVSAPAPSMETLTETDGNLTWFLDKAAAYEAAARSGKPVFIDFYGSWCTNCAAFQQKTQADKVLNEALGHAVLLKIYDTSIAFREFRDDARFPELRVGLPFFLITSAEGHVIYKTSDFTKTDEMMLFLSG